MTIRFAWNDGDDSFVRADVPGTDLQAASPFVASVDLAQHAPFLARQAMTIDTASFTFDYAAPLGATGKTLVAQPAFVPMVQGHGAAAQPMPLAGPGSFVQSDEVAFIAGVYDDGTLPLYAFSAWNNDNPATYTGGFTNSEKWGAQTSQTAGGTIKYYFTPSSNWSSTEQQMLAAGLSLWSDVANISFTQTSFSNQAQIVFTRGSGGSAFTNTNDTDSTGNAGHTGGSILWQLTKATITIDTSVAGFGPIDGTFTTQGGYPVMTLLHEEGHAIGLGHAGPYNGTVNASQQQFSAWDTRLWSIMSYIEPRTTSAAYYGSYPVTGTDWGFGPSGFRSDPTGLMPLDILAAQQLYGLPTSTVLSGGQTFGFHCNITGPTAIFFDFSQNSVPILSLWDMGTGNTLDLSGFTNGSTINLSAGTYSSCAGMINNLAIAYNTQIDTFVGTSGADSVTANNDGDMITGGAGNDSLIGGIGSDTAVYSGARSDYAATNLGSGITQLQDLRGGSPDGTDQLTGIEFVKFSDGTVGVASLFGNTAPSLSGAGNSVGYTEQTAAVVIDSGLVVTDPDGTLAGATVAISAGFVALDTLNFTNQNGITGSYNSGTHVLTLSGNASVADYQTALRSVTFSSSSDDPTHGGNTTRTITFQVSDGIASSSGATSTINVTAIDDPPQVHNDNFAILENGAISGNVFANNGNGADFDPDGPSAMAVFTVNGQAAKVGVQFALPSGALVQLNADGTLTYNPNHAFDHLPAPGSGALNTTFNDTFTYQVTGGTVETATVTITGVDSDDTLDNRSGSQNYDGGIGNDTLSMLGAHTDYNVSYDQGTSKFTFVDLHGSDGTDTAKNIENFSFTDGIFTYDSQARITSQTVHDAFGRSTTYFDVDNTAPWAAKTYTYSDSGSNSLVREVVQLDSGSTWYMTFNTAPGSTDLWTVSYGPDSSGLPQSTVTMHSDGSFKLHFEDKFNEYAGWSNMDISFDASGNIVAFVGTDDFGRPNHVAQSAMITPMEVIPWQLTPYDPDLGGTPENTVLTGGTANDILFGFDGNDTLNGGAGNDILDAGRGNDTLTGGIGDDHFVFRNNGSGLDVITDFTAGNASGDVIELHAYGIANFAALQAMMTQVGADVVITFDPSDTITLQHVTLSQLNSGDFVLS